MRKIIILALIFCLYLFSHGDVSAQSLEEFTNDSIESLEEGLTSDQKDTLEDFGVDSADDITGFNVTSIFSVLSGAFREKYLGPIKIFAMCIAVMVITSFFKDENTVLFEISGAVSISLLVTPSIVSLIESTHSISVAVSGFLLAAIPVYITLLVSSGNTALGSGYGALSILGANALVQFVNVFFMPALSILLGISLTGVISHLNIKSVCSSFYKLIKWFLIFCVTAFSGLISVQAAVMGATDVATTKTMKFIASSAIPVVGGAFGDGVAAVQNSVKVLKSGAGAFGMLASISIFIAPVVEILLWLFVTQGVIIVADFFEVKNTLVFLSSVINVIKLILAINLSICIISIVISAITLFAGA